MAGSPIDRPFRVSSIQRKYVRCRRQGCSGCPHGPYLYRTWRDGGAIRTEDLGRMPVPRLPTDGAGTTMSMGRPAIRVHRPDRHPFATGDRVMFAAGSTPCWIVLEGRRQFLRDDTPLMDVDGIGWGIFGSQGLVYPYVMLTLAGRAVFHPYDGQFLFADPARRLDRRFPAPLVVREGAA